MTANGRLDYFGRTVNVAARLGDQRPGHDVVLLGDVFDQARATARLAPATWRSSRSRRACAA
jgi:class 3 adenylate cyclase